MPFIKFLNKNQSLENLKNYGQKLSEILSVQSAAIKNKKSLFISKHIYNSLLTLDYSHEIFNKIIKREFLELERSNPEGGIIFLKFISSFLQNLDKTSNQDLISILSTFLDLLKENYKETTKEISFVQIKKIIHDFIDDPKILKIIEETIKVAGSQSKIFVEASKINKSCIEIFDAFNFNLETYGFLFDQNLKWEKSNPRVLVVDGIIASVSEIDSVLVGAAEKKEPLVIFAKDFENEILTTIHTNNLKSIFDIFLVKVPIMIETLNVINDVAVACNTDIISTLKGNILSILKFDNLPKVEQISCFKNNISIKNTKSRQRATISVKELIKARDNQTDEMLIKLLNNRIKSLSSSFATIKIASPSSQEKLLNIEKIDKTLRLFNSLIKFGVLDNKKLMENIEKNIKSKILFGIVENVLSPSKIYPAKSATKGLLQGISCAIDFLKISGIVLNDKE